MLTRVRNGPSENAGAARGEPVDFSRPGARPTFRLDFLRPPGYERFPTSECGR